VLAADAILETGRAPAALDGDPNQLATPATSTFSNGFR